MATGKITTLKTALFTGTLTTNDNAIYFSQYGQYIGQISVNTMTNYDASIWAKRKFLIVKNSDAGDGSVVYPYSLAYGEDDSTVIINTPKPSRSVRVKLIVVYQ